MVLALNPAFAYATADRKVAWQITLDGDVAGTIAAGQDGRAADREGVSHSAPQLGSPSQPGAVVRGCRRAGRQFHLSHRSSLLASARGGRYQTRPVDIPQTAVMPGIV